MPQLDQSLEGKVNVPTEPSPTLCGPARLCLRGVRREHRAIGLVEAEPRIRVAGEEFSALELSLQLSAQAEYVRLPDGRVAADLLREAGLAGFGRAVDGATLAPFPLGPEAVLWHDFSQVPGPWQDILPLGLQPPATGSLCKNAYNHLEWLRTWGFSGGLVGTLHKVGTPLIKWLKDYANRVEQAAVLIIGTITVQNYINRLADGELIWRLDDATNQKEPKLGMLNLVTPELLEKAPSIAKANWDIVCLINADSFLATKSTRLFGILHTMPKALFVGLFAGLAFREREAARDACASLLGISPVSPTHMIWRYLLRNPAEAAKPLPEPPSAQPGSSETKQNDSPGLAPYSYELRSFLGDAKRYEHVTSPAVPFRAYYHLHPSYGSMDKRQLAWYLYWRAEVRQCRFPDTGLDYVTLYATELINGFGMSSVVDGYEQLMGLWLNYRDRMPPLDNWLPDWLCDYLLVNGCPVDPLLPLQQAAELNVASRYTDLLLARYAALDWEKLPFALLEQMLNISLEASEIYTPEDRAIIAEVVLRALAGIDAIWKQQDGRGILARFRPHRARAVKRLPFTNALFARSTRLIYFASYYPYSEQPSFVAMLLGLVKQAENLLRAKRGYRGRVRGASLVGGLPALIEQSFRQAQPKPRIEIDAAKVALLTRQSDEVRDLLLAETEDAEDARRLVSNANCDEKLLHPETLSRPIEADISPYQQLAACLGEQELLALATLLRPQGWDELVQHCQQQAIMPELLLDNINACALESIGDLLIDTTAAQPEIVEEYLPNVETMLNELGREVKLDDDYHTKTHI